MLKGKPFVKWAGGKRQIMDELKKYIPKHYNTYYEPFLGGGALLFELSPKKAVINDFNKELMNVYKCIKNDTKFIKMCQELNLYEKKHCEEFYFEIRNKDRDKNKFNRIVDYKRAARTIYLNKACFNGLYRVNSKNEFNVPFNKKEKINTYDRENLNIIHTYLNLASVKILDVDFEQAVSDAVARDFIYLDPPYDSDTATFNSYTQDGFDKLEQVRLAKVFRQLSKKGCYVMLSNHNTLLINELYKDYHIHVIQAKRMINSNGKKRGKVEEVIITNFEIGETFEESKMVIKDGVKRINRGAKKSIVDIECNGNYELNVFQGDLGVNDIIIKYSEGKNRIRTPKHIHWAVDILMKRQGNELLTKQFLHHIYESWKESQPLKNNTPEELSTVVLEAKEKFNIELYEDLNHYGEYEIDFLFTLLHLLMVQQKTNREDAYMFASIIEKLLEDELDIFSIISTADFGGKN